MRSTTTVKVVVNIRPLVTPEVPLGCAHRINVFPSEKQVRIGSHAFTFNDIFENNISSLFEKCIVPIVNAFFDGYNGTVLAYGQTGSGKTYTMGTNYNGEEHGSAVIPRVMDAIFTKAETMKESTEICIRVSFIEIFKEEVFDLLDPKTTNSSRVALQIREKASGEITLAGVTEAEVRTKEEMASYLLQGSVCRATGSTNMNAQSSRSHAIFTILMEQKITTHSSAGDDVGDGVLVAKLHLVDLAGSERAKRTGADGTRLQEGININKGLLALGNVISALGDDKKRKEGGHIPYRDSKLTRILQDSLGGNCKTVMIACISPADTNAEETLNTLKYANRARNIQNKAIINRDPAAAQLQKMRSQIEQLQAELLYLHKDSDAPAEEIKILKHKISLLEASIRELQEALQECRQLAIDAQVERDRLIMHMECIQLVVYQSERDKLITPMVSIQNGKPMSEMGIKSDKDFDTIKSSVTNRLIHDNSVHYLDSEDDGTHLGNSYLIDPDLKAIESDGMVEVVEEELEHSSLQEKLDKELKELNGKLEKKEIEIEELRHNLANISYNSDDSAHKLKNVLETQVADLKKKQDAQAQLLRQKQKSDEFAKRLNDEIHRIKTENVQLQQKIKQESEQFWLWKASPEKEVLQEGRNEYELHQLLALNQRQKLVLQRKIEETADATIPRKELQDSRKASRETPGAGSNKGPGIQELVQSIEHELDVTVGVHEVRSEYERQMKEKAKMAEEVARLKEEVWREKQQNLRYQLYCREKDSEIREMKGKIVELGGQLEQKKAELSRQENLRGYRMDTSDDDQAEYSNDDDTEWEQTIKKSPTKKRNHRTEPTEAAVCCNCTRNSGCKTSKCKCRAARGSCSKYCLCEPTKCSNRGETITTPKDLSRPESSEAAAGNTLETERTNNDLASHGAMLLQNALSEKPVTPTDLRKNWSVRKPLSDIGNNLAPPIVPKPTTIRKRCSKSTIQLVPAAVAQP